MTARARVHGAKEAAMAWTRLAEGEDALAVRIVEEFGYVESLKIVEDHARGSAAPPGYAKAMARWAHRYDAEAFARDRDQAERAHLGFVWPEDPSWPQAFDLLGPTRPLGIWHAGSLDLAGKPAAAIVGSRDCSDYGRPLAFDLAFELARRGYLVVSGGAFGIDAAAHEGALAAADGRERPLASTAAVFANGLARSYPKAHTSLFARIVHEGGLLLSEAVPEASPHRHRFLSRNRIIAALAGATFVVEAPYRSGAISTARHALTIGREVGAFPGPVTSPRSAGCHRLLREGAVCVTGLGDALELLPPPPVQDSGGGHQETFDLRPSDPREPSAAAPSALGLSPEDPLAGNPLAVRVREGLAPRRARSVGEVAREAGVSTREAIGALAALAAAGIAEHEGGLWKLAPSRHL